MYFNENYFFYIESLNETSGNHAQKQLKLVNARLTVVDLKKVQINDLIIKIIKFYSILHIIITL